MAKVTKTTENGGAETQRATTQNEYSFELWSPAGLIGDVPEEFLVKADEVADLYDSILQTFPANEKELYIAYNQYFTGNYPSDWSWVWVGATERAGIVAYCAANNVNYIVATLLPAV